MMKRVILAVCLLFVMSFVAQAQDVGQPFAAIEDGTLTLYGLSAEPVKVNNPANTGITSLVWSPDGKTLAYLLTDTDYVTHLMITDGGVPAALDAGEIEAGFPVTFTNDGFILYVGRGELTGPDMSDYQAVVKRIAAEAGALPEALGRFAFQVGCGGGSPLPGDWRYWDEAGFGGNYLTLAMTDFGLLHSTRCAGVGLALLDLQTGEDKLIGPGFTQDGAPLEGYSRAALSPDGKQVAALYIRYDEPLPKRTLAIIDLATLDVAQVPTADNPDQIAWGSDGALFYSVVTFKTNVVDALTDAEKDKLRETNTMDIPGNEVFIHQINPASGEAQVIYGDYAYAIGRMAVTANGESLMFSQVANQDAWIKAIADGTLDVLQDFTGDAQRALVPVPLYQIMLGSDKAPILVGDSLTHFTLSKGIGGS